MCAIDEIKMNHRIALVRFTLAASLNTGLTTDATIGINKELILFRNSHLLRMDHLTVDIGHLAFEFIIARFVIRSL